MYLTGFSQAIARKWKLLLSIATLSVGLLSGGCDSMSHTDQGILAGAGIGAVLGTMVGIATHHPGAGAAIGAGVGGVLGGAEGAAQDHAEHKAAVQQAVAEQQRKALSLYDVAKLTAEGVQDQVIINQIRASGAVYALTADDISYLHNQRVSDAVISEMQASASRPATVIYRGPAYQPVYVYDPYPPPGVVVGVRYGRRW